MRDALSHPFCKFNADLAWARSKLEHVWLTTPFRCSLECDYLPIPTILLVLSKRPLRVVLDFTYSLPDLTNQVFQVGNCFIITIRAGVAFDNVKLDLNPPEVAVNTCSKPLSISSSYTPLSGYRVAVMWALFIKQHRQITFITAFLSHYGDVIMGAMTSQITSLTIVYSTVYSSVITMMS